MINILLAILALSILIVIHELGHFLFARLFGMRVEKFFLFFDVKNFKISKKIKDTEYGIGIIPFGGYVKISGILDENMDKESLKEPPKPYEFRSKPVWQRILVMLGGILFNTITAILVFALLKTIYGEPTILSKQLENGIYVPENSLGYELGLRTGDKIVSVNGTLPETYEAMINPQIFLKDNPYYEIVRDGQKQKIQIPADFVGKLSKQKRGEPIFLPRFEYSIAEVAPNSVAKQIGLQKGDKILSLNGVKTLYFDELKACVNENKNKHITLKVLRDGNEIELKGSLGDKGLGVIPHQEIAEKVITYNFFEAIPVGAVEAWNFVVMNVQGLRKIFKGELSFSENIRGPLGIIETFGQARNNGGWFGFLKLTAIISVILAFTNLLPIPALDGGHVVLLLYEGITRREPSIKVREIIQVVGFFIIIGLMIFATFNDILRFFR
ncbi:MAG: RIP metalloprotease RseP [Bacteroidia bacterium]|nr:RIP metalloprotease RseP [Bacteroidia bacterium]MDW8346179.1 RIP metalloprotease RseP [Bacteroidia bacterium]